MGFLNIFLLVLFVITAILLVLLVLVQNEDGDSLGGVFAGGSSSAFGSRSGNVLTKASSILGAIFLVLSFALAVANRTPGVSGVEAAGREVITQDSADWWKDAAAETTHQADGTASTETAPPADSTSSTETPAAPNGAPADSTTSTTTETAPQ